MSAQHPATTGDDRTSLDELLSYETGPPPTRQSGLSWTGAAGMAASAAAISAFVVFGARVLGVGLPFLVVFSVTLALLGLQRVVRQVHPRSLPGTSGGLVAPQGAWQSDASLPDGAVAAAARWDTRLSWTQSDPERFARMVVPVLADLVDERLRQRHGVNRATDPQRARHLLGDPLWTFMTEPVTRSLTPRELAALVAEMEKL